MSRIHRVAAGLLMAAVGLGCSATGPSSVAAPSTAASSTLPSTTPPSTALPSTAPATPTTGPSTSASPTTESPAIEDVCLVHDGIERCAEVYLPRGEGERPILIDLHGWGSDPGWQRARSGFLELAVEEDFIVAWPAGVSNSFNAGGICCEPAVGDDVDDTGYLRALVAELASATGGHDGRVFATGLSNGCAMAQRFGVEASDLVDAVACFAFYLLSDPPAEASPVPLMEIHALDDPIVAYNGLGILFPGAEENINRWAEINRCDLSVGAVRTDGTEFESVAPVGLSSIDSVTRFEGCRADTVLVTLNRGGHLPYRAGGLDLDTTRLAWAFLAGRQR